MIIWENIGLKRRYRFWRKVLYILMVAIILAVCFYSIVTLEAISNQTDTVYTDLQCQGTINEFEAELDAAANLQNGDLHCFCTQMMQESGVDAI